MMATMNTVIKMFSRTFLTLLPRMLVVPTIPPIPEDYQLVNVPPPVLQDDGKDNCFRE
jgi:hypothetical protein